MSISDFLTAVGTLLAFFSAGCGLGYFVGYHFGRSER
jgi:hypothetical protein